MYIILDLNSYTYFIPDLYGRFSKKNSNPKK